MVDVGAVLSALVEDDEALGKVVGERYGPWPLPQGTALPCITWTISGPRRESQCAASPLQSADVTFMCWAGDYSGASALGVLALAAFVDATPATVGDIQVCGAVLLTAGIDQEGIEAADPGWFGYQLRIRFWLQP